MAVFKLLGSSLKGLFAKPTTTDFPFAPFQPSEGYAGRVEMSSPDCCVLCGACQRACPTACIEVDKKGHTWLIAPFSCVQCNSCVRVCPKECLVMLTEYHAPSYAMTVHQVYVPAEKQRVPSRKRDEEQKGEVGQTKTIEVRLG